MIEQRKVLWDRMAALEAKASEPGRYNNRGGQLLKEERERKTIANKLPKIEAELTELVSGTITCFFLHYFFTIRSLDPVESIFFDYNVEILILYASLLHDLTEFS